MHRSSNTIRFHLTTLALFISSFLLTALNGVGLAAPGSVPPGLNRAIEVQKEHAQDLLKKPGVVGTAVGLGPDGGPVMQVYTEKAGLVVLPKFLDGIQVQEITAGKFHALEACDYVGLPIPLCQPDMSKRGGQSSGGKGGGSTVDPTAKFPSPVPIGVSIGNRNECAAGTIGARVANTWMLSNNHVFARLNTAQSGEDLMQPGQYDTNCIENVDNHLGDMTQFAPISFSGLNLIDAAIATFGANGRTLGCATPSNGYGAPDALTHAASTLNIASLLNTSVQKYGRTTSLTKGSIVSVNWIGNVGYSTGTALFVDQIVVYARRAFVKAGDSGSLVVGQPNQPTKPSGLLFAGDQSGKYGIVNRIDHVLQYFQADLDGGPTCAQ